MLQGGVKRIGSSVMGGGTVRHSLCSSHPQQLLSQSARCFHISGTERRPVVSLLLIHDGGDRRRSAQSVTTTRVFSSSRSEESYIKGFRKAPPDRTDKQDDGEPDLLRQYFNKRKAVLAKQEEEAAMDPPQSKDPSRLKPSRPPPNTNSHNNNYNKGVSPPGRNDLKQQMSRMAAASQQKNQNPDRLFNRYPHPNRNYRNNNNNNNMYYKDNEQNQKFGNQRGGDAQTYRQFSPRHQPRQQTPRSVESGSNNMAEERRSPSRLADMLNRLKQDVNVIRPTNEAPREKSNDTYQNSRYQRTTPSWKDRSIQGRSQPPPQQQQQQQQQDQQQQRPPHQQQQSSRPVERSKIDFLSASAMRRQNEPTSTVAPSQQQPRVVTLPAAPLTVSEASALLRIKVDEIQTKLREIGAIQEDTMDNEEDDTELSSTASASLTPKPEFRLDVDMMELLSMEFGIETNRAEEDVVLDSEQLLMQQRKVDTSTNDVFAKYPPRPPVVTIMGHVDHGKTTLMDALRRQSLQQQSKSKGSKKTASKKKKGGKGSESDNVAGTEAGGITQIISAFEVSLQGQENKVTFLDTPGHAAFTAMRHSGTHAADVIVLVVAADDGISEQTVEIINLYKSIVKGSSESGISMVVALNKIDKPGIDVDEAKRRIENQLLEHGIIAEGIDATDSEYGQPVQVIPTSGLTGQGLDDLMEGLLLQSEVMDLRADDSANAEGIVMDARMEKGLGAVVDCIIRWGNIKKGDVIISGDQVARVRMLKDVNDKVLKKGLPSQPVRIIGFKALPKAGDPLMVVESEQVAEDILEQRLAMSGEESDRPDGQSSDVELHIHGRRGGDSWRVKKVQAKAGLEEADGSIRIPIIVKADADGSLSAVRDSLVSLGQKSKHMVVIDPISEGIGEVTASDIQMAKESEATIFAFGLKRIDQGILNLAETEGVQICSSDIIYSLLDSAQESLGSYLPPTPKEHIHGRAVVKAVFTIDSNDGKEKIAGMNVLDGYVYKATAPSPDVSGDGSSAKLKCHFRVFRQGKMISPAGETTTASSLRRFKEVVDSVRRGDDCGLGLVGFDGFEEGDEIECYSVEMKKGVL